jgi:hypothetical protein
VTVVIVVMATGVTEGREAAEKEETAGIQRDNHQFKH